MLKDTNGWILINESKKIKQSWKEYTEVLHSKDVNIHDNIEVIPYLQELLVLDYQPKTPVITNMKLTNKRTLKQIHPESSLILLWTHSEKTWLLEKALMLSKVEGKRRGEGSALWWIDSSLDDLIEQIREDYHRENLSAESLKVNTNQMAHILSNNT